MRPGTRIVLVLLLLVTWALPAGSAQAQDASHHDNVATAIVESDGGSASDFAWGVSRQRGGDTVDQLNGAHALAHCTDCRATAVAFQIVLASGSPATVAPRNVAEAINAECTRCVAAAEARQFVRVVDEPVRFTSAGLRELADVRRDLRAAVRAQGSPADLHTAVEHAEARVRAVLADDLVTRADPDEQAGVLESELLQSADQG